jgi:hypothetical protein
MERHHHDGLPTLIADTESLRKQLAELHASVKAKDAEQRKTSDQSAGGSMVVRGK